MSNFDILKNLMDAQQDTGTQAYDTTATVRRIEGSTAWVHIPGGVDETPVRLTINAKAGDTVQLRVGGGSAWLVGNQTAPPTDDTKAEAAQATANTAKFTAAKAIIEASDAKKIADNTNQYFWMVSEGTDTGAHITEVTRDEFLADPDNGGGNLLARSNGIAIRDGLTELATFSSGGLDVTTYDSNGNDVEIAHLGYGEGNAESGTAITPYYTLGTRREGSEIGNNSLVSGVSNVASGADSQAFGANTKATGVMSFAEGYLSMSSGWASHAEGYYTKATFLGAHSEGFYSEATGRAAHAEGGYTVASGAYSHAQNVYTLASSHYQTAIGKYNVEDTASTYAFIIGNGDSNARSNALTVDWDGNVSAAGQIKSTTETYSLELPSTVSFGGGLVRNGGIAMLSIINISKLPAGETTICTLPEGWRPPISVMRKFEAPDNSLGPVRLFINSSGVVTLYNYGAAITSASNVSDTITYVLA